MRAAALNAKNNPQAPTAEQQRQIDADISSYQDRHNALSASLQGLSNSLLVQPKVILKKVDSHTWRWVPDISPIPPLPDISR